MGRLPAEACAEQNGARTKAIRSEKTNVYLRIGFSSSARKNNLIRAKEKFTPPTASDYFPAHLQIITFPERTIKE
jgi:hypothetical protein